MLEHDKEDSIYKNDFFSLIKDRENALPIDFCLDLLKKRKMKNEMLMFLFHKEEYDRLFELIKTNYEISKGNSDWLSIYIKYLNKSREIFYESSRS